jgi:DNA-binding NarL/FixJ family response regulator
LAEFPYDLLLLDQHLYGSGTPEACLLLHKSYPALKIVLLSVDADDEMVARSVGAHFIYKGASPEKVVATLETLLKMDA